MMTDEQANEELASSQQPAEKMLSQSEVNSLIGRAKQEAQDRTRRQMEQELQQRQEQPAQQAEQQGGQQQPVDVDKVYQEVQERFTKEMQQKQLEQDISQVATNYQTQLANGAKDYDDFQDVVKDFNPAEFPELVILATQGGNASDIIYEISKNPQKLVTINSLAKSSPAMARAELAKIGQSIAANKAAKAEEAQAQTSNPLDRMQPTNKNGSNGRMSISDLQAQPWLRG